MEIPRIGEEIDSGPQKEREIRTTALDHLNCLVSLDIADHENSSLSVPYVAGRLKQFQTTWQSITSDSFLLNAIKGVKIGLANNPEQSLPEDTVLMKLRSKLLT